MHTDDRAFYEIRDAIDGRSAQEIDEYVSARDGGVEGLLELVFAQLPGAFLPERAGDQAITFQYVLTTAEGERRYHAVVRDGLCRTGRGDVDAPTVTMVTTLPVFL